MKKVKEFIDKVKNKPKQNYKNIFQVTVDEIYTGDSFQYNFLAFSHYCNHNTVLTLDEEDIKYLYDKYLPLYEKNVEQINLEEKQKKLDSIKRKTEEIDKLSSEIKKLKGEV